MNRIVFSIVAVLIVGFLFVAVAPVMAQEKMSKDEWQSEMAAANQKVADLQAQLKKLGDDVKTLQGQSDKLDADLKACQDALYGMLGVTAADVDAYDKELTGMENRVAELQRMSDADLAQHKDEVEKLDARLKEMAQSKIALIPRYGDRVRSLQEKVTALLGSMQREKTYTVGTWSKNRDCLWNIAKKKDVYANAWLWPKIWQGNRDKIKDPDLIKPKWVLKIPEGNELSKTEKSAAKNYYRKKASAPASDSK